VVEHPGLDLSAAPVASVERYQEEALGQSVVDYGLHAVFQHVDETVLDEMTTWLRRAQYQSLPDYDGRLNDHEVLRCWTAHVASNARCFSRRERCDHRFSA
jgi:hypothetical protein